jgi:hypothetical protein
MRPESHVPLTPRMEEAVQELKGVITQRFPQAAFVVEEGAAPQGRGHGADYVTLRARNTASVRSKYTSCSSTRGRK